MIQSLFLPNDCNDGSERLQPADWSGLLVQSSRGRCVLFFFPSFYLCGLTGGR